jgi:hypothetical protein
MKFHTSIDIVIEQNLVRNSKREAIWLNNTEPGVRVKFYNNLFINEGLAIPTEVPNIVFDNAANWNAYVDGATGSPGGSGKMYDTDSEVSDSTADFRYTTDDAGLHVNFRMDATPFHVVAPYITPDFLAPVAPTKALIPEAVSEHFFGHSIDTASPIPGPFAELQQGGNSFTLWAGAFTK